MSETTKPSLRRDQPELWAKMVAEIRSVVGDWTEDQIASVIRKVRAADPDNLPDTIGRVFCYCAAAMESGDEEAIAAVELWQIPNMPIEIMADGNGISHRLSPDASVEVVE